METITVVEFMDILDGAKIELIDMNKFKEKELENTKKETMATHNIKSSP